MADLTETQELTDKLAKRENRKLVRCVARSLHRQQWELANPEGAVADRKADFEKEEEGFLKSARQLRKLLRKNGVSIAVVVGTSEDDAAEKVSEDA